MIYVDPTLFSTHKLCVWYLCHSSLYYQYDNPCITDETFDSLCKELLKRLKQGEEVQEVFKEFISIDNLEAGSGYSIGFHHLPQMIQSVTYILYTGKDFTGNKINYYDWIK